jgi:hypothetical protein
MTNREAKETLQATLGLIGVALLKTTLEELAKDDENRPVTTFLDRYRESVEIACDCIDIVGDNQMEIEKKVDGDKHDGRSEND